MTQTRSLVCYTDPPSKRHLGVCAIYSETTALYTLVLQVPPPLRPVRRADRISSVRTRICRRRFAITARARQQRAMHLRSKNGKWM